MENGRRRKRPKSAHVIRIPRMEWMANKIALSEQRPHRIDQIDVEIKIWDDERLQLQHLAAERTGHHQKYFGPNYVPAPDEGCVYSTRFRPLGNAFLCTVEINALCVQRSNLMKSHASDAMDRRHGVDFAEPTCVWC